MTEKLCRLPENETMPMAHAMTEFAFDLFYLKYQKSQSRTARNLVKLVDISIKNIQSEHLKESKRHSIKRANNHESHDFVLPFYSDISIGNISIYRWRRIEGKSHKFNIVVDPQIAIGTKFEYDRSGFKLDISNIPETIMYSLRARVESKNPDTKKVYLNEILLIEDVSVPKLKITAFSEGDDGDTWFEMEDSWETWETMKARINSKYK